MKIREEKESIWAGAVEGAFFDAEWFDKNRKIQLPEFRTSSKIGTNGYYVFGVDVGRRSDQTEILVIKVQPQSQGYPLQNLVNICSLQNVIFDEQAKTIRRMYEDYKPRAIVIDGTGVGSGLVDLLVKPQYVVETGELLPSFGVINDEDGEFRKYKDADTIENVIYVIKANTPLNTEMHANLQNQLRHGRVKFLIDENTAKGKLLESGVGRKMSPDQRGERLRPYTLTTVLKMQLLNLTQENEGQNIILKQSNRSIKKDKVSSLEMALYWIKLEEDKRSRRKAKRFADFMFLS